MAKAAPIVVVMVVNKANHKMGSLSELQTQPNLTHLNNGHSQACEAYKNDIHPKSDQKTSPQSCKTCHALSKSQKGRIRKA